MKPMHKHVLSDPKKYLMWITSHHDVCRIPMFEHNAIDLNDEFKVYRTPFAKNGNDNTQIQYVVLHGRSRHRFKTLDELQHFVLKIIRGECVDDILKGNKQ